MTMQFADYGNDFTSPITLMTAMRKRWFKGILFSSPPPRG